MSLLPRTTLHSDSKQYYCTLTRTLTHWQPSALVAWDFVSFFSAGSKQRATPTLDSNTFLIAHNCRYSLEQFSTLLL
jgi:hypothetical protein